MTVGSSQAFIGIDIAKKNCVACVRDRNNAIREITSYRNTSEEASRFAKRVAKAYGECSAVVESTGNMWLKTYEAFESEGMEIKLANPSKTRIIAEAKIKTDKLDARILSTSQGRPNSRVLRTFEEGKVVEGPPGSQGQHRKGTDEGEEQDSQST